jgi:phage terminase large subunit
MTFAENGVDLFRASNNRLQGWHAVKELFKLRSDGKPGLIIFNTCGSLIDSIKCLQHDKTNAEDVSKHPHNLTHGPDALRYFAQTYVLPGEKEEEQEEEDDLDVENNMSYHAVMCGGAVTKGYIYS